jgi:hypothetical protein
MVDISSWVHESRLPTLKELGSRLILILVTFSFSGACFGAFVRYSSDYTHDVFLKEHTLENVKVVMFTSHHTVLLSGEEALVLVTSDIVRLAGRPRAVKK